MTIWIIACFMTGMFAEARLWCQQGAGNPVAGGHSGSRIGQAITACPMSRGDGA